MMKTSPLYAALTCLTIAACLGCCAAAMPTGGAETKETTSWWSQGKGFSITKWFAKDSSKEVGSTLCEREDWRTTSLKTLLEIPAAGLFEDLKGSSKWEISGMTTVSKKIYMIFDSLDFIGEVDQRFEYLKPSNTLIGEQGSEDSGFEAIEYSYDTDTFIVIREAVPTTELSKDHWHASILEVQVKRDGGDEEYKVIRECPFDYKFLNSNKGLEGGSYFAKDGERYLLGLCEGNFCEGGEKGSEPGNGRVIVSKYQEDSEGKCMWAQQKVISLPSEVDFADYADMSVLGDKVSIVSQENSAIWIGNINTDTWEITGPGEIFHFPRDEFCKKIYCNIEGIVFLDENRIAAASDRSKADQPYECVPHDQSVMVFQLPERIEVDRSKIPPTKPKDLDV